MDSLKKYIAECLGTFVLVFVGCGTAIFVGVDPGSGYLTVALAFGLSIIAMAYVIGNISGCHINPAVSLSMFLRKKITAEEFAGYAVFQVLGAIIAAGVLQLLVSITSEHGLADLTGRLGANGIENVGIGGGLIVEIILTFIFILTILGVTSDESKSPVAGLVIGLTLAFVHIIGISLTGTSVNPARSIGPALFAGGDALTSLWLFIVGPLVGAVLAVFVFQFFATKR